MKTIASRRHRFVPAYLFAAAFTFSGLAAEVSGELKQWHKVTLTFDGPLAREADNDPNPFTDFNLSVTFSPAPGASEFASEFVVPGYFAADGKAGESGAAEGNKWRVHFAPDRTGPWTWRARMVRGKHAAAGPASDAATEAVKEIDGQSGSFDIGATDKTGRDFRGKGRLQYVGKHYLRFAGSGEYFLKAGPDAPETLLAYADFDGTEPGRSLERRKGEAAPAAALKTWQPHVQDWRDGDPVWRGGKGKGLIGALNYLAGKGLNAFSFLTYNAGGDGDNVWPFVSRPDKLHYDCSKLDQWGIVFDHATARGLFLHFKLQENEMDDNRLGSKREAAAVPESLDGGALGRERRLYCRELIARFGHALALNWNIGEENTQSTAEVLSMADYIREVDPYDHSIVVHTFPDQQIAVYRSLLRTSAITGASLQNSWDWAHELTGQWVYDSASAGKPWIVCNDEQNPASMGVPPDIGYRGHSGIAKASRELFFLPDKTYTMHDIRKRTLWGTLMAGGAGVEYYFGYELPENDLVCEDFRSRDRSWDYCRIALEFFREHRIPVERMECRDEFTCEYEMRFGQRFDLERYCLTLPGEIHLVYLPNGGTCILRPHPPIGNEAMTVKWFNPRSGGPLKDGTVKSVSGGQVALGDPPADADDDWLVIVRKP